MAITRKINCIYCTKNYHCKNKEIPRSFYIGPRHCLESYGNVCFKRVADVSKLSEKK